MTRKAQTRHTVHSGKYYIERYDNAQPFISHDGSDRMDYEVGTTDGYVICFLKWDQREECYDINSVGTRICELDAETLTWIGKFCECMSASADRAEPPGEASDSDEI